MSLRAAIDAMCKDCGYDPLDTGRWKQQIDACTVTRCPLYEFRPRSKAPLKSS